MPGKCARLCCVAAAAVVVGAPALGEPDEHRERAREMAQRAIDYLRSQQDELTGGWSSPPPDSQRPHLPAISSLVITGMLMDPGIDGDDPAVARALEYILSFRQEDGGIYDRILPSYNTAITLSALARAQTPEAGEAIPPAQDFLRRTQWSEEAEAPAGSDERPEKVGEGHPFYGGIGYGRHGRPDLSNLALALQGLHDSGVPADDPAFQRALVFLSRVQMHENVNDLPYARDSRQGGFIYATGTGAEDPDGGQSFAGEIVEHLPDGRSVSRLRAYGSMTYAGFKSYIYADLPRNDDRVQYALAWIRHNYTLAENPGLGVDGLYYYYITFARALDAWGEPMIEVAGDNDDLIVRDWAVDLIDRLAELQNEDGSFRPVAERWMEADPVLITAYSLVALQHARLRNEASD